MLNAPFGQDLGSEVHRSDKVASPATGAFPGQSVTPTIMELI